MYIKILILKLKQVWTISGSTKNDYLDDILSSMHMQKNINFFLPVSEIVRLSEGLATSA